jgi:hypothetical protein
VGGREGKGREGERVVGGLSLGLSLGCQNELMDEKMGLWTTASFIVESAGSMYANIENQINDRLMSKW